MLECPLYTSIGNKFQKPFENVVLGSLKSFFQLLDHEVEIRVEAPITNHIKRFSTKFGEIQSSANFFPCRKIKIKRISKFSITLFLELKLL